MAGSSITQVIGYAIQAAAPPFPVFCIAATIIGFGASIQDAQANGLVASVHEHSAEKMGLIHAIYGENFFEAHEPFLTNAGVGAFAAPLVSTQFSQLPKWSFHFLTSLGIALINTAILTLIVGRKSLEGDFFI
jgi:MFS family permease